MTSLDRTSDHESARMLALEIVDLIFGVGPITPSEVTTGYQFIADLEASFNSVVVARAT